MSRSFKQELVGVFGQPVAENPTQVMIEAAFAAMKLDWRYAVRGARAMGFRGFNCTIPHKVAALAHLDDLTPAAKAIGAVNCVVRQGEKWLGENTDGKGFLESVRAVTLVEGKSAVLLGCGRAGEVVVCCLAGRLSGAGGDRPRHQRDVDRPVSRGECPSAAGRGDAFSGHGGVRRDSQPAADAPGA
jgi:shikimate dehydrogenase